MKLRTLIKRLAAAERSYLHRHHRHPHIVDIFSRESLGDHVFVLSGGVERRSSKSRLIMEVKGPSRRMTVQL